MGTLFIANGIAKLIRVASDAYDIQCRMWPHSEDGQSMYVQDCSAFECKPPHSIRLGCPETQKCDFSTLGSFKVGDHLTCPLLKEPVGAHGFSSVHELKAAPTQ